MEDWFCPLSAPSTFAPSLAFGKWFVNSTGSPMQRWHSGMRDRVENEWERERGRSALWCAASTEEQAVLCPSPTLRHEGESSEWMRDEWEEGGVERMDGDFCPLLYEWLALHVSYLQAPVLLYKSEKDTLSRRSNYISSDAVLFSLRFLVLWQLWQYVTLYVCVCMCVCL